MRRRPGWSDWKGARVVALWVLVLGGIGHALVRPALAGPTPTPVEEILDVPSEDEAETLIRQGDLAGAQAMLARIREAARGRGDWDRWVELLKRESMLLAETLHSKKAGGVSGVSYDKAIRLVTETTPPRRPEIAAARLLLLADLHERAASGSRVDLDDAGERARKQHLQSTEDTLAQAFALRADLGTKGRDALHFAPWGPPVRATARDAVTYLYAELLGDRVRNNRELAVRAAATDVLPLLGPLDPGTADPVRRMVALLDDLERWHTSAGRREAALEARIERARQLFQLVFAPEKHRLIVNDLKRRLALYRDVPWWSMGMAELALFVNEAAADPREPMAIALEGERAYPASPGGKQCAAIARILRCELDDPEVTVEVASWEAPSTTSLVARHVGSGRLWFRAWSLPVENLVEGRWRRFILDLGSRRGMTPPPLVGDAVEWDATLPTPPGRELRETRLETPLQRKGLYLVGASLDRGFDERLTRHLLVLVTDLVLAVSVDDTNLWVRVLSSSTGRPVEGAGVRLLKRQWDKEPKVLRPDSALTSADGLVTFPLPPGWLSLVVEARHGDDVAFAVASTPPARKAGVQPEPAGQRAGFLVADHPDARPGERVRWRAFVARDRGAADRKEPEAGVRTTVSLADGLAPESSTQPAVTGPFGTVDGQLDLPPTPLSPELAEKGWRLELREEPGQPGQVGRLLAHTYVSPAPPRGDLAIQLDPLPSLRGGARARIPGVVIDQQDRPVPQAHVSWLLLGLTDPGRPPRGGGENGSPTGPVASGEATTNSAGGFVVALDLPAAPQGQRDRSLYVTARDTGGRAVTVERAVLSSPEPFELGVDGPTVLEAGEAAAFRILRGRRRERIPLPGSSLIKVVREPLLGEGPLLEPVQGEFEVPDYPQFSRHDQTTETMLGRIKEGAVVVSREVRHDRSGLAWFTLPPLAAGHYRLVAESRSEDGEVVRATRPLVVWERGIRLPVPLAVLTNEASGGKPRILVSSCAGAGPVIIEAHRPGWPIEARVLESPVSELVEAPVSETGIALVRVMSVYRGRLLVIEKSVQVPDDQLVLGIESLTPELTVQVRDQDGKQVEGVEVAVAGVDAEQHLYGLDARRYLAYQAPALVRSGYGLSLGAPVEPVTPDAWLGVGVALQPGELRSFGGRGDWGPACCGGSVGPARPRLPLASSGRFSTGWNPQEPVPSLPIVERQLWEPRLRSDSQGRVPVAGFRLSARGAVRVLVAAVAKDGRVGYLETVILERGLDPVSSPRSAKEGGRP